MINLKSQAMLVNITKKGENIISKPDDGSGNNLAYLVDKEEYEELTTRQGRLLAAIKGYKESLDVEKYMRLGAIKVLKAMSTKEFGTWNPAKIESYIKEHMLTYDKVEEKDAAQSIA